MTPGLDSAIAVLAGAIASAIGLWANYKWGPAAKERKSIKRQQSDRLDRLREWDRVEGRQDRHDRQDTPDDGEQDS
jgi:hypothetical protein